MSRQPLPSSRELAWFFLKLGTTAFGGPVAHIALMETELVRRKQWVSEAEFLDLLAAANLLPGPTSTELAIYLGYRLGGLVGLVLAGVCFILPAFLMVFAIAWAYMRFQKMTTLSAVLYGVKPVVLAVVVLALWRLSQSTLKTTGTIALAVLAACVVAAGVDPLLVLAGSAVAGLLVHRARPVPSTAAVGVSTLKPLSIRAITVVSVPAMSVAVSLTGLFLVFLKLGSVVFGSGYVLLAFLRDDLVTHRHWLTEAQLLDAVAVGQVTPGPVFTTATFVGYVVAGPAGAVFATVGIFCPAFLFVALTGRLVRWIRNSPGAAGAIDGVRAASLALMAVATCQLASTGLVDWLTISLAVGTLVVLLRTKLNSVWLIAGGALAGVIAVQWKASV